MSVNPLKHIQEYLRFNVCTLQLMSSSWFEKYEYRTDKEEQKKLSFSLRSVNFKSSKVFFGILNSSKNERKQFNQRYHSTVRSNFFVFVRFLEELKTSKCSFEINWPLGLRELKLAFKNKRIPLCESVDIVLTPDEVFFNFCWVWTFTKKK